MEIQQFLITYILRRDGTSVIRLDANSISLLVRNANQLVATATIFFISYGSKKNHPVDRIDQTMHTNLINNPLRNVAATSIFVHDIHHEDGNRSTSRYRRRKYSLYDHTLSNWQSTYRTERWQIMTISQSSQTPSLFYHSSCIQLSLRPTERESITSIYSQQRY